MGLKVIFSKQLPNMPREYICRLLLDRRHRSCALVARNGQVLGGITYRVFPQQVSNQCGALKNACALYCISEGGLGVAPFLGCSLARNKCETREVVSLLCIATMVLRQSVVAKHLEIVGTLREGACSPESQGVVAALGWICMLCSLVLVYCRALIGHRFHRQCCLWQDCIGNR
jgi:hypothetical protein